MGPSSLPPNQNRTQRRLLHRNHLHVVITMRRHTSALLLSLAVLLSLAAAHSHSYDASSATVGCPVTMEDQSSERVTTIEEMIADEVATIKAQASIAAITVPAGSITVPVNAVIIQPVTAALLEGFPLPTAQNVIDQVAAMNAASADDVVIPDSTPSGVAAATPFTYKLCRAVQSATPNDAWFASSTQSTGNAASTSTTAAMKAALHVGGRQTLNMYVKPVWRCFVGQTNGPLDDCPPGTGRFQSNGITQGNFAGIATFPWNLNAASALYDGTLVHTWQLPGYTSANWGGAGIPNNGHPGGSHEVGHWQGLLHTFENSPVPAGNPATLGSACNPDAPPNFYGDGVTDTKPMFNPSGINFNCVPFAPCAPPDLSGCPDTCPATEGSDPNYNMMNYLDIRCHREYSDGQAMRMEASWNLWRAANPQNILNVVLPTAVDDSTSTFAGASVVINVLANDVTALVAADLQIDRILSGPTVGTATVAADARSITYTPPAGFAGTVTLTYSNFDCNGVSALPATVTITVVSSVTCAAGLQIVTLPVAPGGTCDDAPLPAGAVTATVGYTLSPPGPYAPGTYTVTATPNPVGGPPCDVQLQVVPCQAGCVDRTVPTDPGACQAATASIVVAQTVGRTALSTTQTPPAPYPLGTTSPVSVVVNYPGGVVSAPSNPGCRVVVQDEERPVVMATNVCTYPQGKAKYKTATRCFDVAQLATARDNCPLGTRLAVTNCALEGPPLPTFVTRKLGPACTVSTDGLSLCVLLPHVSRKRPRVIRATVRGWDGSGNFADVTVRVTIYAKQPKSAVNPACLRV